MVYLTRFLFICLIIFIGVLPSRANNVEDNIQIKKLKTSLITKLSNVNSPKAALNTGKVATVLKGTHNITITDDFGDEVKKISILTVDIFKNNSGNAFFTYDFLNEDGSKSNAGQTGLLVNGIMVFHWALFDTHSYFVLQPRVKNGQIYGTGLMFTFVSLLSCGDLLPLVFGQSVSCTALNEDDMNGTSIVLAKISD